MSEARVVFWGAGKYAEGVFGALCREHAPVAYGDNDTKKQGTRFMGLPVLSLEGIEASHPGCRFYLTVDRYAKAYIIASLLDRGIDQSRIINFEEFKKYRSCWDIENHLVQTTSKLKYCCGGFGTNHPPEISIHGGNSEEAVKNFFSVRDRTIEELNVPATSMAPNPCLGCCNVKEGFWSSNRRIRLLTFQPRSICNFRCFYCSWSFEKIDDSFIPEVKNSLAFLRFMKERGIIDTDTEIQYSGGEISIHPLENEILAELQDHPCLILTNAYVYSEKVGEVLSKGRSRLYPSIDAGTRGTFAKIKGVDAFDKVRENLARYATDGLVHLKYIILPGVNDNQEDIDGFVRLCETTKIAAVDVTRECHSLAPFSDSTVGMIARMMRGLRDVGVGVALADYAYSGTLGDKGRIDRESGGGELA
jgi:pyruvate-formate lyase-activating enzyme